jgi:predicted ATPase/class 3 adenylate cyclase
MAAAGLPSGTVTFMFTDIEGSTQRWERNRAAMQAAVRRHETLVRAAIEARAGHVFKTVGDEFCAVFVLPSDAVAAALDAQRALSAQDFSDVNGLRVRMSVHTGNAEERDGDYFGPALNRTARLLAIGHGGQVLLSGVAGDIVQGQLPPEATLREMGAHRLRDLARPEVVYQLLAPGLPAGFPPLRSLEALPNNLPLQLTSFVGRDKEVADVAALLGEHRIVTLIGAGGVGKTRVSLQVGADLLDAIADGVWFIELAPLRDPALIPGTVAQTLGVTLPPEGDPLDNLAAELKSRHLLLLFDNCEHMVAAAAAATSAILHACPNVKILASSRQGLGIRGESTYRMPSLAIPSAEESAGLHAFDAPSYGSIALFVARAEAANSRFTFTDDVAPVVADICRRLDGIPLALELAAARVAMLNPKELRVRLDQRFRVLTGGSRDALPRQQTLRALIDWSHELLDERERKLFRRLGVFVGGFTLEGAAAVASDETLDEIELFDVLASLVDKSLVVAELSGETTRYRLLESTRAYAVEKLEEAGESANLALRRFTYLHGLVLRVAATHEATPREATVVTLAVELEDLRGALDWALTNDPKGGAEMLSATPLFHRLELYREGGERAESFAESIENDDADLLARLWIFIASCRRGLFAYDRSFEAADRALSYARASSNTATLADALATWGRAAGGADRLAEGKVALLEAETIGPRTQRQRLDFLTARASLLLMAGEASAAMQALLQLRGLHQSLGNDRGVWSATANLAEIEHRRGETQRAITFAREALALAARLRKRNAEIHIRQNLAGYLIAVDDRPGARAEGEMVLRYCSKNDPSDPHVPVTLGHLALAYARDGEFERAARLEGYVEKRLREIGYGREFTEIATQQLLLALLRERFEDDEREALFAIGADLSAEEAIAEGLGGVAASDRFDLRADGRL